MNIPDLCCGPLDDDFLAAVTKPGHWVLTLGSRGEQEDLCFEGDEFCPPADAYKVSECEYEESDEDCDELSYLHFHVLAD